MAEDGLIAAYLRELRYSVSRLPDADDIAAEAEDHLLEATDRLIASGRSPAAAEAEALGRFGSAALIARVCIAESKRGPAVPTIRTRQAGLAALLAPVLLVVGQLGNLTIDKGWFHGFAVFLLSMSFPALVFGLWGLRKRHGGLGRVGRTAFVLALLAPPLSLFAAYAAIFLLGLLLCLVVLIYAVEMLRAAVLPVAPLVLLAAGPLGILAITVAGVIETVGGGDAGNNGLAPVAVAIALTAAGFAWLGWHLWQEPAVDAIGRGPLATA